MFIQYQTICCQYEETHYSSEFTNIIILQKSSDTAAVRLLNNSHFGVLRNTAKSDCQLRHVRLSVHPPGTTWFPLDGFS